MSRPLWIAAACLLLLASPASPQSFAGAAPSGRPAPNVLLVILDDVGKEYLRAYTPAAPALPTLDALATSGRVLTDFWVNPVCGATRTAMLTGRLAFRTGQYNPFGTGVSPDELTLGEQIQARAPRYAVAAFGKLGIDAGYPEVSPATDFYRSAGYYGFHRYRGPYGAAVLDYWSYDRTVLDATGTSDGEIGYTTGTATSYLTSQTTADVIAWLDGLRAEEVPPPWVAWLGYHSPHEPLHEVPGGSCGGGATVACYEEMLADMDAELGLVLASIPAGELSRTLVWILGDNGGTSLAGGGKFTTREDGINVPSILAGGLVRPDLRGVDLDGLWMAPDVFETVLDLVAAASHVPALHPDDPGNPDYNGQARVDDGESLRGAVTGESSPAGHDCIWSALSPGLERVIRCAAVGSGLLKLKRNGSGDVLHLLPDETTDVSGTYPTELATLQAALAALEATEP